MKLRRHFLLAALAGRRKPLPALFCSRCEAFYRLFLSYNSQLLSYNANRKRAPVFTGAL